MDSVVIKKLAISKDNSQMLFIVAEGVKDVTPACSENLNWSYVMPLVDETDKQMYSMLLAARASQATVSLEGNSLCAVWGNVETLVYISY